MFHIQVILEWGLIVSVSLFLVVLFQKFEKPKRGIVKYALSVQIALVLDVLLVAGMIFIKNQLIYDLFGDLVSGTVFLSLVFVGLMAFASIHWNVRYDEYGIIYTDWFSAPFVIAWNEIQEVRKGKFQKSDLFVIVSEEMQCRINDAWLCVGVEEFLQAVQRYAPDCVIDEKIRSNYEI
ncbi:MAG TPA: hypothetical protein DCO72_09040 [Ruminococcus sp.]|nr:hypothetical protein [Ruminococcus sp.]